MVDELPEAFAVYTPYPVIGGRSGAQVFRLVAPGKPTLFLKRSEAADSAHLQGTAARLEWLRGKLPVPEVVHFHEDANGSSLVMTAVPGTELTHFNEESSALKRRMTVALARALRQFHAVEAHDCPFDHSAGRELERLEEGIAAREAFLGAELRGAREKLEQLRLTQPEEHLVLTHGDACLPNIMVENHKLSGFIDLGCMGLGDRCRDLERALWSLAYNYGDGYEEVFLGAYGATETDRTKVNFYRDLEWFSLGENET